MLEGAKEILDHLLINVGRVIVGKDDTIRALISCWLAGGHALIEDVPGTGKTMLARALSKSAQLDFKRVQFTPDLLPSDILGTSIYNQSLNQFEFMRGPLFTTIFLADEINRATPRTQSALLECMAERQITVEGQSFELPSHFFVIATQNPVEQHGTFPLPEAQLDRFMMKLSVGYPTPEEEIRLIQNQNEVHPIQNLQPVESEERILYLKSLIPRIRVSEQVYQYAARIVHLTRNSKEIKVGVSPRGMIALIRAAQATALFDGLDYVKPSHVFHLAVPVLAHRLTLAPEARLGGLTARTVLESQLKTLSVPVQAA